MDAENLRLTHHRTGEEICGFYVFLVLINNYVKGFEGEMKRRGV